MEEELRLDALRAATPDRWVALSADETHIVAEADSFEDAAAAAARAGEADPILIRVPEDWTARVF